MRQGMVVLRLSKQRKEEESGAAIQQRSGSIEPQKVQQVKTIRKGE